MKIRPSEAVPFLFVSRFGSPKNAGIRRHAKERITVMKYSLMVAAAAIALGFSGLSAEACNPFLDKAITPTKLPAEMLAENHNLKLPDGNNPIVGLWHVVHTDSNGNLFFESYDTWHSDGNELEEVNGDPRAGQVCLGQWTSKGTKVHLLAHVTWLYDINGNYQGTMNMTQTNTVRGRGNEYDGTFDCKIYDPNGNQVDEVTGTTAAERLVSQ
ncbi:MAG TPA: hypothetical protein VHY79_00160 [Rhizomicrobium sp.]|nr:hypothetical protein [Rhizomicrobium sp.]